MSPLEYISGSAGAQPLRISRILAIAEFSVKSFALFMLWRVFEALKFYAIKQATYNLNRVHGG